MNPRYFRCVTPKVAHIASTAVIEAYNSTDKIMEVVIQEYKDKRSIQQNRYYWAVMKLIGDHFGYTDEEAHEYFKSEFLKSNEREIFGKETAIYGSTTKLTKAEFSAYMEQVGRLCAENGFVVPPPLALGYEL